jgi:hypothetical protein
MIPCCILLEPFLVGLNTNLNRELLFPHFYTYFIMEHNVETL